MCYACGEPLPYGSRPGFNDVCTRCGKDIHVCRMCAWYKPGMHWDCSETIDDPVPDKERRNHCEWFKLDPRWIASSGTEPRGSKSGRDAFDALFRN